MPEYIVISNLGVEREKTTPHRNDHLDYLSKLKKMGNLRIAGKFSDGSGGIYILEAESYDQAIDLAEADPYHSLGLREYTIKEWERKL
jgi:uncharacterized protein YciI|tara:strand:+ start:676 stop:939 length:264 start_codon:yes stop_codon:yes gene_type:complete